MCEEIGWIKASRTEKQIVYIQAEQEIIYSFNWKLLGFVLSSCVV